MEIYACSECIECFIDINMLAEDQWYEGKCNVCKVSGKYLIEASRYTWFNNTHSVVIDNGKRKVIRTAKIKGDGK